MDAMLPRPPAAGRGRMTNGERRGRMARRGGGRAYFSRCAQYTSTSVRGSMSVGLYV